MSKTKIVSSLMAVPILLSVATNDAQEVDWYREYTETREMRSCAPTGFNRFAVVMQTSDTGIISRWRSIVPPGAKLTLCWGANSKAMVVVGTFASRQIAVNHAERVKKEIPESRRNQMSVMQGNP